MRDVSSPSGPETLLIPGPVNTCPAVRGAALHHVMAPDDARFGELLASLTDKLRRVFCADDGHDIALMTGSGTAAIECAIASSVPTDGKILVIDNGAHGERLHEIARIHGMNIIHLRYAWGELVSRREVERAFDENPDIAVVAMVHHDTSVGLLNPVKQIGAICRRYDALLIVDAISSLGAEDIDVVRDHVDLCCASADHGLHAASGVSFVCVSPRARAKLEFIKPRSLYLDLKRYLHDAKASHARPPFTPAIAAYVALNAACAEFLADGHKQRLAAYRRRNARLRRGLSGLGIVLFTRTGREAHSMVTCCVPDELSFEQLYNGLKQRGYIVAGCGDVLGDRFFRVANMGHLEDDAIDGFVSALGALIAQARRAGRSVRSAA